ncbi:MAG: thioredoxin domain-containing protein [Alphaproteobacteria bacterium]|nr:thioredoxin domain-containing protein [Alphaproteobacteria bacterium]
MIRLFIAAVIFISAAMGTADAQTFTPEQKKAIEKIVADYIKDNPEKLASSLDALQEKMLKEQEAALKKQIKASQKELSDNPKDPIIGNPKGDVVIVEFFDYNCGYCKVMFPKVIDFVKKDGNTKWVLKEMPILMEGSGAASKVALAAKKQGKYEEIHKAFMEHKGQIGEKKALEIAKKHNLDMVKLQKDMASKEIQDILDANRALALKLQVSGIPVFFIGDEMKGGAFDEKELPELAKKIRAEKKK